MTDGQRESVDRARPRLRDVDHTPPDGLTPNGVFDRGRARVTDADHAGRPESDAEGEE